MRVSAFVVSFLLIGFFLMAVPQNSYAGVDPTALGCCVDNNGTCLTCGGLDDCAVQESQCDAVNGNFTEGQICFETMLDGCAGPDNVPGCCIINRGVCQGGIDINECTIAGGLTWVFDQSCSEQLQCTSPKNVPSLSQWGLVAVAAVLGIVGLFGVLRRRASA